MSAALDTWPTELYCPNCGRDVFLEWRADPGAGISTYDLPGLPARTVKGERPWVICEWGDWEQRCETSPAVTR